MSVIARLLITLLCTCLSLAAHGEKLRIVTEPWAPYVYEENGKVMGLDYETTAIVFQRLGIDVEWQFLPWKRCLAMLETGQADGALDIFHSDQRDSTLLYPSEPLSDVEFVMFYAKQRPHPFQHLDELKGLTIGTSPATCTAMTSVNRPCSSANRRRPMKPTSASCCWGGSTC